MLCPNRWPWTRFSLLIFHLNQQACCFQRAWSNWRFALLSQLIMLLLPVWASMLLGLLVGFLPLVGMEPMGGAKPDSDHAPNTEPLPSSSDSNCSQLTLKLEFSSKVVEHGKKNLFKLVDVFSIKTLPHRESRRAFMKIRSVIGLHDIYQTNKWSSR